MELLKHEDHLHQTPVRLPPPPVVTGCMLFLPPNKQCQSTDGVNGRHMTSHGEHMYPWISQQCTKLLLFQAGDNISTAT